jgi:Reverse transcriptase (RNA-dependent DNA polymerase)
VLACQLCLVGGSNLDLVTSAKADIASVFRISDLGEAKFFLGIEIMRAPEGIFLSQAVYCGTLLEKHATPEMKSKRTPFPQGIALVKDGTALDEADHNLYRSIVGGLLYLSVNTMPDISYAVGSLARYMSAPTTDHMTAAKHVLRYLTGTKSYSLFFPFAEAPSQSNDGLMHNDRIARTRALYDLCVYCDADFANNRDSRKSVTGVFICEHMTPLAWSSKLQSLVTTSTTEAEFVAAASAIKEGLWILKLIREMHGEPYLNHMRLLCDNQAAVSLMKQPSAGVQGRSKHIDVQFKFVKERCQKKHVDVEYIRTDKQLADLFTKQQTPSTFATMVHDIGVRSLPTL